MKTYIIHQSYGMHEFNNKFKCKCGAVVNKLISKYIVGILDFNNPDTLRDLNEKIKDEIYWNINSRKCRDPEYIKYVIKSNKIYLKATNKLIEGLKKLPKYIHKHIVQKAKIPLITRIKLGEALGVKCTTACERSAQLLYRAGIINDVSMRYLSFIKHEKQYSLPLIATSFYKITFLYNKTNDGKEYIFPISFYKNKPKNTRSFYQVRKCSYFVGKIGLIKISNPNKIIKKNIPYKLQIEQGEVKDNILRCDKNCLLTTEFGSIKIKKGYYKIIPIGIQLPYFFQSYLKHIRSSFKPIPELAGIALGQRF